jgi:5-methylcytosine-specific restriction endonuclease McrA
MKSQKICIVCNKKFHKPYTESISHWQNKRKYCSKVCAIKNTFLKVGRNAWNKGKSGYTTKPCSEERKLRISLANKGQPRPSMRGENHFAWKGGISFKRRDLRNPAYVQWRLSIFQRDNFTCQMPGCGIRGGKLESHHIKSWSKYPDLRFEITNGITLCRECHRKTKSREEKVCHLFELINFTRS